MLKWKYIAFEGVVGSGKTLQSKKLADEAGALWVREPGGDQVADMIRKTVQGTDYEIDMEPVCEQYLYAASRAQTLRQLVKPHLQKGGRVVSDRSVYTSLAYQGYGRGLGDERVWEINKAAVDGILPDVVIFIDVDVDVAMARTNDKTGDKFEKLDANFFNKVRRGYLEMVKKYPNLILVDGNAEVEEVSRRIQRILGA